MILAEQHALINAEGEAVLIRLETCKETCLIDTKSGICKFGKEAVLGRKIYGLIRRIMKLRCRDKRVLDNFEIPCTLLYGIIKPEKTLSLDMIVEIFNAKIRIE